MREGKSENGIDQKEKFNMWRILKEIKKKKTLAKKKWLNKKAIGNRKNY